MFDCWGAFQKETIHVTIATLRVHWAKDHGVSRSKLRPGRQRETWLTVLGSLSLILDEEE